MVVSLVRVDFGNAEGEEREGEVFEGFAGGERSCGEWGEQRILLGGFFVGRGLEGAEGTFDWVMLGLMDLEDGNGSKRKEGGENGSTSKHVLPLAVQQTRPRLQILPPQPFRQGQCFGVRHSRCDGHLLPTLLLCLRLPSLSLCLGTLLLCLLLGQHLLLVGFERLLFQFVDVLLESHPGFPGILFDLCSLHGLELLGGHATLFCFGGELLLHHGHLLRRGLLGGVWWGRHGCVVMGGEGGRERGCHGR